MKKGMTKHMVAILTEMCDRVNVKFKDIDFKKEQWFMEHPWDKKEEDSFIEWMIEYLNKNKEARKETMKYPHKRNVKGVVEFFVNNYGWVTKIELITK